MAIDANMKILCICFIFVINSLPTRLETHEDDDIQVFRNGPDPKLNHQATDNIIQGEHADCWMNFKLSKYFLTMDRIDSKYAKARQAFHDKVAEQLNSNMLKMMAPKAFHNTGEDFSKIPSGTKLGGLCMMWGLNSILIFSRMKLRNDTVFKMNFFETDMVNMTLRADVSLNDLLLVGAYERSATHTDPSVLLYSTSAGEVQALLNDVRYKMFGLLRLQGNGFVIESVTSELVLKDRVSMTFVSSNGSATTELIDKPFLGDFIERLKTSLDLWIKEYFNENFSSLQLNEVEKQFQNYEKFRIKACTTFSNYIIKEIKDRIETFGLHEVTSPHFTLLAVPNMQIQLKNGVLRGFDTIYKRSVATGRRHKNMRQVDMIVGFSNLKVEYEIDIIAPNQRWTSGHLQLGADDVTAHLRATAVMDPDTVNLEFMYIEQLKPESLIVSGDAEQLVSKHRRLIETTIIALMTNVLKHNLRMLSTLTRCRPLLHSAKNINKYRYINKYEKRVGYMQ